jgi:hypothetical protein
VGTSWEDVRQDVLFAIRAADLIAVSVVIATETAIKSAASSRMSEMSVLNNSHGSLCEDRKKTLLRVAPDLVSGGARMIFGVYTCDDGSMARLLPGGRVPRYGQGERDSDGSGTWGKDPER